MSTLREGVRERAFVTSGEANEASGMFGDFFGRDVSFTLFGAQFHARDQAAEILVSRARFDEQWIAPSGRRCDLGADVGADGNLFCGEMEPRRAVDAVAIEQSHGAHAQFGAESGEFFGHGSAFEKAEGGAGVEFDVHALSVSRRFRGRTSPGGSNRNRGSKRRAAGVCGSCAPATCD